MLYFIHTHKLVHAGDTSDTIAIIRGKGELSLFAERHGQDTFIPTYALYIPYASQTLNNVTNTNNKLERSATGAGAIEDLTAGELYDKQLDFVHVQYQCSAW